MILKYKCDNCHQEFETKFVFNGFCPYCNHDQVSCFNFDEWDRMTKYGKKRQEFLDRLRGGVK